MSHWMSVIRAALGMGLAFAAVAGVFFSVLAAIGLVFFPGVEDDPGFMVIAGSIWAFATGVSLSAVLAITTRGRSFDQVTIPRIAAVGAAGGLLLAGLLVGATWQDWPNGNAIVPFTMLPLLGAGAGTVSLLLARWAEPAFGSGDETPGLPEGEVVDATSTVST